MKRISLLALLLTIVIVAQAQLKEFNKPWNYKLGSQEKDIMVIDLGNGEKMEITYNWFQLYAENKEEMPEIFFDVFDTMFQELSSEITKLKLNKGRYHITYNNHNHIQFFKGGKNSEPKAGIVSVEERLESKNAQKYKLENGKLTSKLQWQHILELDYLDGYWNVKFYLNDLDQLERKKPELYKYIQEQKPDYLKRQLYKRQLKYFYEIKDGEISYKSSQYLGKRHPFFALHLYPSVGTTILKGKLSTDFGMLLGASFNEHQNGNLRMGIRYQLKGFGDDNYLAGKMHYNGFIDGLMDINLGKSYNKKQDWVGFGLGYLVNRSGEIYGKNTARIFFKYRSSNLWGIQPEFNYSFKESKGYIGLGLFFSL